MRVVAVHEDVLVATSRIYQTACVVLRSGGEGFVVDSPLLPDELDVLPALLEQSGFPFTGLLATHGDWDHLLGRLAFADAALGVAETTAARLTGAPGEAARGLRRFDDEHYVARERPLSLGQVQALPVPGHLAVGDQELELHATAGHSDDGMALLLPWARVLVVGDYLTPVAIPIVRGSVSAYLATLRALEPLVDAAETVVSGHGGALDPARAAAILREDRAYLEALPDARLPLARRTAAQQAIHEGNLDRLGLGLGE